VEIGRVRTVDYHTGGEPFRIVPEPPVEIRGRTVAERRFSAMTDPAVNALRRLLCLEPRGHADMYGGFLVPPDDDGARLGVLFWHKDGFSTACGHGTIALGAWAVRAGLVPAPADGTADVALDVPSGRVTARVHVSAGRVSAVEFVSVPSYLIDASVEVTTSRGVVTAAVGYGGAIYAQVDAASAGLTVAPEHHQALTALGREVRSALGGRYPADDPLGGVYGTVIYQPLGTTADGALHQRNVTIFADGALDRSPCGSGTAARVATLTATGELGPGQTLVHDSIVGSRFTARAAVSADAPPGTVVPVVTGMAYPTGEHVFEVDPDDPMAPGFVLR
jgi:proline racemase